ncbi:EAL domain-containing protein [Planococcus sp. CP5-4]|uniref:bifunctional diguanylate cyclase/phosphodiesterase n=1 Tax=unclassified Planococcus (in: firmicutes) TaxID=2662419 RepID=UPI001C242727|nr:MULTISPECIES: EAL domain-containing protein [unclassified Planococcus (in: firmicutes)]MBU9673307.1 EAL domain-containing protein [Planococcus sp. CP5-4_YE]MBV0908401.1 EAL domain-containing protein [Planococcus sp. CP5-4_UN]MBW6062615.1 EAL domain-containing protein [Planococcus sp. CP5-4]
MPLEFARLVFMAFSVLTAISASYIALLLIGRIADRSRKHPLWWVGGSSLVFGTGIFSMHFIGILTYHSAAPVQYDPILLSVSLLGAISAAFPAFYVLQTSHPPKSHLYFSGFAIGFGVLFMHYIGDAAAQVPGDPQFNLMPFLLSIAVAFVFSFAALRIFSRNRKRPDSPGRKFQSAIILGLTISAVHYIGMQAVSYSTFPTATASFNDMGLAFVVSALILLLLAIAGYLAFLDRKQLINEKRYLSKIRESERRFRRLAEMSPEAIAIHSGGKLLYVNEACLQMFDESDADKLMGTAVLDYVHPQYHEIAKSRIASMNQGLSTPPVEQVWVTPKGIRHEVEVTGMGIEFEGEAAVQLSIRDITEQKKVARELEYNRQRYESLFQNNSDGIFSMDPNGKLVDTNVSFERLLGYSSDELISVPLRELIEECQLDATRVKFQLALEGITQHYETLGIHKSGHRISLRVTHMPIVTDGTVTGVYGIAKDISAEKRALALLAESEEKYRSLFDYNLDAVFELDNSGHFVHANSMTEELSDYTRDELIGLTFAPLIAENLERVQGFFLLALSGEAVNFEQRIKRKDGEIIEVDINAVPKHRNGEIDGVFAIVRDITEKKASEQEINRLAFTDQLTGLPNRHWFYQNIREVLARTQAQKQKIAVLLVDFDDFKNVNDLLGHFGGDQFLKIVANRIHSCLGPTDAISRFGGDEFIIVSENTTEPQAHELAQTILRVMREPVQLLGQEFSVTLSIGIAFQKSSESDGEDLIKEADFAMYSAKENGKNNVQVFTQELDSQMTRKSQMEQALKKAIDDQQFALHYQPQINLASGEVIGYEALLRWQSPFGNVPPSEFIPIAEETGLIVPIGEWALRQACRDSKEFCALGHAAEKISVNVSARQFKDPDFSEKVQAIFEQEQVDPGRFEIEITESVMLDIEQSARIICELKALGLRIAIDDFGAGYSSLNVVKNVEIDTLKIDKSLIDEVLINRRNLFILAAIIEVGKNLDARIVIEGIELEEQAELLRPFGILGQGYLFSRPLPPGSLDAFLSESDYITASTPAKLLE